MPTNETSSVSLSRRGCLGSDPLRTVVWVRGEHDVATRVHLRNTIAQAASFDDADIVVDLSNVTFMDAATIDTLVAARQRLGTLSRLLSVRDPSPRASRVLDLCGLSGLIDEGSTHGQPPATTALGSWVDVPARDRTRNSVPPQGVGSVPFLAPVRVVVRRRGELAGMIQQRRAPS